MAGTSTGDGLILSRVYPPNFSDTDLQWLLQAGQGSLSKKCPKYGEWLIGLAVNEMERRKAEQTGEPVEVQLPHFVPWKWTGAQLADALTVSAVAIEAFDDRPAIQKMLKELDLVIRAWVCTRLRKQG